MQVNCDNICSVRQDRLENCFGKEGEVMPKTHAKRNHFLHIRINDFEQQELESIALETGQTISDFVRVAILEKKERVRMYNENKNKKMD